MTIPLGRTSLRGAGNEQGNGHFTFNNQVTACLLLPNGGKTLPTTNGHLRKAARPLYASTVPRATPASSPRACGARGSQRRPDGSPSSCCRPAAPHVTGTEGAEFGEPPPVRGSRSAPRTRHRSTRLPTLGSNATPMGPEQRRHRHERKTHEGPSAGPLPTCPPPRKSSSNG